MNLLFHQLITSASETGADREALSYQGKSLSYAGLRDAVESVAAGMKSHGLLKGGRVAVYLPKQEETVIAFFAISRAGGIFVPVNPVLKPQQVAHILSDCGASMLVTSADRAKFLAEILPDCANLKQIVIVDADEAVFQDMLRGLSIAQQILNWQELLQCGPTEHPDIEADDSVAILYTSGSTGKPKGVVVSHRNLVIGSESICNFLNINKNDRILALLPFSFDYGLNQLTSVIRSGASLVLMNYLLPQEVTKLVAKEAITGLAAVPSLWAQLASLEWPESAQQSLRYITSSGGTMPQPVLAALQQKLPRTDIFLMYGLTEAFRSTYLPPKELTQRPTSIGKAIPNATLSVVKPDGSLCRPGEPGELVHSGPLVAKGYWNNPEKTAKHFRPLPGGSPNVNEPNTAVWSGDTVTMDEDGYLYFIGREDDMIKTSGYRVSPTEVEEVIYETGLVSEVAAFGAPHPLLGQAIVVVVTPAGDTTNLAEKLLSECKKKLPSFMIPMHIDVMHEIPKNLHGKFDRKNLAKTAQGLFTNETNKKP
jgi:acyl-CoA ligase (AMP-forming) (exosortase A-associated)